MFIYMKYMEMIITNTWLVMALGKSEGGISNWTGVLRIPVGTGNILFSTGIGEHRDICFIILKSTCILNILLNIMIHFRIEKQYPSNRKKKINIPIHLHENKVNSSFYYTEKENQAKIRLLPYVCA